MGPNFEKISNSGEKRRGKLENTEDLRDIWKTRLGKGEREGGRSLEKELHSGGEIGGGGGKRTEHS